MSSEQDKIREDISQYLFSIHKDKRVMSISRLKVTERQICISLRDRYSVSEVLSNLLFLVSAGWVKQEKIEKVAHYSITDRGMIHFDGPSVFQKSHFMTGVNITNTNGIVVVGDHNFVRQEFTQLYNQLDSLKDEVGKSALISDDEKIVYQSEIETIKNQLAKQAPNPNILKESWNAMNALATISGVMQFYQAVHPLITTLFK